MITISLLWLLFAFISVAEAGKVIKLTLSNYNATLEKEPLLLVNYYAPWCAHCKKLTTELTEVAADLIEYQIPAKIASMDVSSSVNADILQQVEIEGYPTLLVYKYGKKVAEYHGGRTHRDILFYLQQKAEPRVRRLTSQAELLPYISQFERGELQTIGCFSIVVGAFTRPEQSDSYHGLEGRYAAMFNATAERFDLALFFITDDPALLAQLHVQTDSMLIFQELPDAESEVLQFNEEMTEESLMLQLLQEALPLTLPYNSATLYAISFHPVKSQVLMFSDTAASVDPFLARMEDVALRYKSRLLFIEISPEEYQLLGYFGLTKEVLPQIIVVNMTDPDDLRRHHFTDYLTAAAPLPRTAQEKFHHATSGQPRDPLLHVESFLDAYLAGNLPRKLLTEATADMDRLNESPLGGYSENIAGSQFEEKVMAEESLDSLVYFHAPWCAHCKSLEPVISEVGQHYFEDPHFMLYRIDGTKNDIAHAGVRIVGYPTLYLFPAQDKQNPIEYDGERSTEALVEFIQSFRSTANKSTAGTTQTDTETTAAVGAEQLEQLAEEQEQQQGVCTTTATSGDACEADASAPSSESSTTTDASMN